MKTSNDFKVFVEEVMAKLEGNAADKGYNTTGPNGDNELYACIQGLSDGDAHAIGEIVYKAVRYSKKKDKQDLIKIAAWAYLVWKFGETPEK
jgi:hypothetical protein